MLVYYSPQLKMTSSYQNVHMMIKKMTIYSSFLENIKWKSKERTYMKITVQNHTINIHNFSCSDLPRGMSFSDFRKFLITIEVYH